MKLVEALRHYKQAFELEPSSRLCITIARIQIDLHRIEEAGVSLKLANGFDLTSTDLILLDGFRKLPGEDQPLRSKNSNENSTNEKLTQED